MCTCRNRSCQEEWSRLQPLQEQTYSLKHCSICHTIGHYEGGTCVLCLATDLCDTCNHGLEKDVDFKMDSIDFNTASFCERCYILSLDTCRKRKYNKLSSINEISKKEKKQLLSEYVDVTETLLEKIMPLALKNVM